MINVRKGTAHSLSQSDRFATPKTGEGIEAGMVVSIDATGKVIKGSADASAALLGFALNSQTDGDVIESGKLGFYQLDGNSIIETDKAAAVINSTNYPVGTALTIDGVTGNVKAAGGGDRVIGRVNDIRTLPTVTIPATASTPNWQTKALLGIKLGV